jgi:hypothetical protein
VFAIQVFKTAERRARAKTFEHHLLSIGKSAAQFAAAAEDEISCFTELPAFSDANAF